MKLYGENEQTTRIWSADRDWAALRAAAALLYIRRHWSSGQIFSVADKVRRILKHISFSYEMLSDGLYLHEINKFGWAESQLSYSRWWFVSSFTPWPGFSDIFGNPAADVPSFLLWISRLKKISAHIKNNLRRWKKSPKLQDKHAPTHPPTRTGLIYFGNVNRKWCTKNSDKSLLNPSDNFARVFWFIAEKFKVEHGLCSSDWLSCCWENTKTHKRSFLL